MWITWSSGVRQSATAFLKFRYAEFQATLKTSDFLLGFHLGGLDITSIHLNRGVPTFCSGSCKHSIPRYLQKTYPRREVSQLPKAKLHLETYASMDINTIMPVGKWFSGNIQPDLFQMLELDWIWEQTSAFLCQVWSLVSKKIEAIKLSFLLKWSVLC